MYHEKIFSVILILLAFLLQLTDSLIYENEAVAYIIDKEK